MIERFAPNTIDKDFRERLPLFIIVDYKKFSQLNIDQRKNRIDFLNNLPKVFSEIIPKMSNYYSSIEIEFWNRLINQIPSVFKIYNSMIIAEKKGDNTKSSEAQNLRDILMSNNLIWLVEKVYSGHKIIVWSAASHNLKKIRFYNVKEINKYKSIVKMGGFISKHFGNKVYSIAFTAYEGKTGYANDITRKEITKPPVGSFEDLCHEVGKPYLFMDFKTDAKNPNNWLNKPFFARPCGYQDNETKWSEQFDAMIYFEKVTPSTKLETESNQ